MIKRTLLTVCLLFLLLCCTTCFAEDSAVLKLDYTAFSIGFQGLSMDEVYGNTLLFSFTNQSAENLMVSIDYVLLDGVLVETFFADMVEPGMTSSQQVVVESAAQYMQSWRLTEVTADLWVYSADNLDDIFHGEVTFLPNGPDGTKPWIRPAKPTDIVVLDNFLVTQTVTNAQRGNNASLRLFLYTEGKTERNLSVRIQKVWINDTPFDVYYTGRIIRRSSSFSILEVPDGLNYLLNIPGANRFRMSIEILERDEKSARLIKRENVSFSM